MNAYFPDDLSLQRPKILHVLEATSAGAARYVTDLLLNLDTASFDVSFAYSLIRSDERFRSDLTSIQQRGIRTYEIPMTRNPSPKQDALSLWRLYRLFRDNQFDLIHSNSSKAGFLARIAARLARSKAVAVYSPHAIAASRFYLSLERFAGLFTDAIVGVSRSERDQLRQYGLVSAEKVLYVTAGIDVEAHQASYDAAHFRAHLGIPADAVLIGSAGRLANQKDPATFLNAAAELYRQGLPVWFLWAGGGELAGQALEQARALGIAHRVSFLGYCVDLKPVLAALDIFALTSLYESFGYVTCEAMAMGKPVVATNVSGSNELVDEGSTGLLVPVRDVKACAEALSRLVRDPLLRRNMGSAGHRRASDHFNLNKMVAGIEQLYQELLFAQSGKTTVSLPVETLSNAQLRESRRA